MSEAIKSAWELVEIIGMFGIILFVLLLIAPIAFVLWIISDKDINNKNEGIEK